MKLTTLLFIVSCAFSALTQANAQSSIKILSATYGERFGESFKGNATNDVAKNCDGKVKCHYFIDQSYLGDPAPNYPKDFSVNYKCGDIRLQQRIREEAHGDYVVIKCDRLSPPVGSGIQIVEATYGGNLPLWVEGKGNATRDATNYCNGKEYCRYTVSPWYLGDPVLGEKKDFEIIYRCNGRTFREYLKAPATLKTINLICEDQK